MLAGRFGIWYLSASGTCWLSVSQKCPGCNAFPLCEDDVRQRAFIMLLLFGTSVCSSGCFPTVYVPKLQFDRVAVRPVISEPVMAGPGSIGPIFSMPRITNPCQKCGPCGTSCSPCGDCGCVGSPMQPVDPFGWLRSGSLGSQEVDPVGWVFGL